MTDEPVYEFVKGQGWVIKPACRSISREITKDRVTYLVTVYDRRPRLGERGTNRVRRFDRPHDIPASLVFHPRSELFGYEVTDQYPGGRLAKCVETVRLS